MLTCAAGAPAADGEGGAALRLLLGLAALVALALLASHRRWWGWRRAPLGAALTTGGYLAVALGLLLGPHAIKLVDHGHIATLRPLVLFCLGWVGLLIGLQLRRDLPKLLPPRATPIALADAMLSVAVVGGAAFAAFALAHSHARAPDPNAGQPPVRLAEMGVVAAVVGAAAIGWSAELRSLLGAEQQRGPAGLIRAVAGLASALAILAYGVAFMLMEHGATFGISLLPLAVGMLVSLLIANVVGLLGLWLMPLARNSDSAFLVVLLGLVSFAAGAAGTLGYSPLLVAMLVGALVVNLPGSALTRLRRVVIDAEQPVAMALMLTAGVIADPNLSPPAALLIAAAVIARLIVKLPLGRRCAPAAPPHLRPLTFAPTRQAPLAIALAVGYAISEHADATDAVVSGGQLVMAVVLIGLASDILAQAARFAFGGPPLPAPDPAGHQAAAATAARRDPAARAAAGAAAAVEAPEDPATSTSHADHAGDIAVHPPAAARTQPPEDHQSPPSDDDGGDDDDAPGADDDQRRDDPPPHDPRDQEGRT